MSVAGVAKVSRGNAETLASDEWTARAACRAIAGERAEVVDRFFPHPTDDHEPAKRVCAGCLVREECLEYALALSIDHGVWGGASVEERRAIRRARRWGRTRLREAREAKSLEQKDLAAMVGIPAQSTSKIECGRVGVSAERAERIAQVLDATAAELFPEVGR